MNKLNTHHPRLVTISRKKHVLSQDDSCQTIPVFRPCSHLMPPWPSRWKSSSLAKSKASCSFLAKDSEVNSAASKPDFFGCLCLKLMEMIAYYIYVCMYVYIYITYLILSFVPIVFVVVYCLLSGNQSIYCSCGSKIYQFVLYG